MDAPLPSSVRLVPRKQLAPVGRWREIALQMIEEDMAAIVASTEDARALGETLRRMGHRPTRRKIDGEGWEVSFSVI